MEFITVGTHSTVTTLSYKSYEKYFVWLPLSNFENIQNEQLAYVKAHHVDTAKSNAWLKTKQILLFLLFWK